MPDSLVPVLFGYSMVTNRWLPQGNFLVRGSLLLHSPIIVVATGALVVLGVPSAVPLLVHWGAHLIVDHFTHDNWRHIERRHVA